MKVENIGIRPGQPDDIDFLFRRLLAELRRIHPWKRMPKSLYYNYMHRRLEHIVTQAVVRVAYPDAYEEGGKAYSGNTRHIIGFIVADVTNIGLVIHYVYTRRDYDLGGDNHGRPSLCYRKQGVARALVESMLRDYKIAPNEIIFTVHGQDLNRHKELDAKVRDEWKMVYNPELFLSILLPDGWETGIVATLDPSEKRAIRQTEQYVPGAF
jgi:hypothetical protein